jgi:signal transduction histidine kinase
VDDAERALRKLTAIEREIRTSDGKWFLVRLRPYRTIEDRIEGVVVSFIDISQLKAAEHDLVEAKDLLEVRVQDRTRELDDANRKISQARDVFLALFDSNPIPTVLTRLDDDLVINVNEEFLSYFHLDRDTIIGQSFQDLGLGLGLGLGTRERKALIEKLRRDGKVESFETETQHPINGTRNILTSSQYVGVEGMEAIISTFIDITDRVQAEQQIRALASELTATEQAERHRLSQILHDDLQQRIFAVQMQLSFLEDAYEKNDLQAFAVDFQQIESWLAEALKVTRQLSVDLSPPILHGEGLVEAVQWLAAQMEEQYGLRVDTQSSSTRFPLEERIRVLVFYAIRELLFNIVKHAESMEAAVRFEFFDSHLRVSVKDHGKGFASEEVMSNPKLAHGLLMIRHRLNLMGCSLQVRSEPGEGTEVTIEVPYESKDD